MCLCFKQPLVQNTKAVHYAYNIFVCILAINEIAIAVAV